MDPTSVTRSLCIYGHTYSKSMDQPGKVASPARGQLNMENEYSPVRVIIGDGGGDALSPTIGIKWAC